MREDLIYTCTILNISLAQYLAGLHLLTRLTELTGVTTVYNYDHSLPDWLFTTVNPFTSVNPLYKCLHSHPIYGITIALTSIHKYRNMADIQTSNSGGSNKHSKRRRLRQIPRVDLTPMVDLAFLLITFFMLTTQLLQQNKYVELEKRVATINPDPVSDCCVLNILIDSADHIYSYEGFDLKNLKQSSFMRDSGIEHIVMEKAKRVKRDCGLTGSGKPRQLVCLIKLLPGARYQNLIDIMDDMETLKPGPYSVQDPLPEEIAALQVKEKELLAIK